MQNELTIIVPVFNEEDCLPPFFRKMEDFFKNSPVKASVLFVDDGSSDRGFPFLFNLQRANGAGWADLRTEVAVLMATSMFKSRDGRPQRIGTELPARRMENGTWANFDALSASNA